MDRTPEGRPSMPLVLTGEARRHGPAIRARHTSVGDIDSPPVALVAARTLFPSGEDVGLWFFDGEGTHLLAGPPGLVLDVPPSTDFEPVFEETGVDAIDVAPTGHAVVRLTVGGVGALFRWSPGTDTFCRLGASAGNVAQWVLRDDGGVVFLAQAGGATDVLLAPPPPSPETEACPAAPPTSILPAGAPGFAEVLDFALASDGETMALRVHAEGGVVPRCTPPEPSPFDPDTAREEMWLRRPDGSVCWTARTSVAIPGGPIGSLGILTGAPAVNASGATAFAGTFRFRAPPGEARTHAGLLLDGAPIVPPCDVDIESGMAGACDDDTLPQVEVDSRYFVFDDGQVLTEVVAGGAPRLALYRGGVLELLSLSYVRIDDLAANARGDFVIDAELPGTVARLPMSSPSYTPFPGTIANRTIFLGSTDGNITPLLSVGDCIDTLEDRVVDCAQHEIVDAPTFASDYDSRYQRVFQLAAARREGREVSPSPEGEVCFRYRTTGYDQAFAHVCGGPPERVPLVGLEVVQSVQSWQNEVFLVQDKPTLVRAHFEHPRNARMRPVLRAFRGDVEIGAPRPLENLGGYVRAAPDAQQSRERDAGAAFWHLEPELLQGDVELRVENGAGPAIRCDEPAGVSPVGLSDPGGDCAVRVRFEPTPTLRVRLVTGRWIDDKGTHPVPDPRDVDTAIDRLRRMFPVARVDVVGGAPLELTHAFRLGLRTDALTQVNDVAIAEGCSMFDCSTIYLGLFRDAENRLIGGDAGVGSAAGSAFIGNRGGAQSPMHEVGHAMGLSHATYCGATTTGVPHPIPDVSTIGTTEVALLGPLAPDEAQIFGLDLRDSVLAPDEHFELMSYCGNEGRPFSYRASRWVSRFTYEELRARHAAIVARASIEVPRRLTVVAGTVTDGEVALEALGETMGQPTEDDPEGTLTAEVRDASGTMLSRVRFRTTGGEEDPWQGPGEPPAADWGQFGLLMPIDPAAAEVAILRDGAPVASRARSTPPSVSIEAPAEGAALGPDEVALRWSGEDGDGDALVYTVRFSPDGGATWRVLALATPLTELRLDASVFEATTDGRIEVTASDGFSVARAEVGGLSAAGARRLRVVSPSPDRLVVDGQALILEAEAEGLDPSALVWRSDVAGELGRGARVVVEAVDLAEGRHAVTVEGDGLTADVDVRVARFAPIGADLAVSLDAASFGLEPATTVEVEARLANRGPETARAGMLTLDAPAGLRWASVEPERGRCNVTGEQATCDLGRIPVGQDMVVLARLNGPPEAARVVVSAEAPVTDADPDGANNQATLALGLGQPMLPDVMDPPGGGPAEGCGCRLGAGPVPAGVWALGLVAALLVRRRRARSGRGLQDNLR
ncbi:MAG: hypothetical protein H6719_07960 [Sandaracinaceae bacterium]|nr:hypothetical protein [Sandaracinaceae bacterium]